VVPHEGVAGRQIRWRSVGRAAAIAAAAIAGIISLPALLGSDKPPPVPPDVGLRPAPAEPTPAATPQAAASPDTPPPAVPKRAPGNRHRLAERNRHREQSHPDRERRHPRHQQHNPLPETTPAPTPSYTPPVYSYVPPPPPEFGIER
jgi:hypothetical protein